ncbi:hypothetical protein B0H14DRAFT_3504471 [Mycena olivaceomarginata]|nr:hypothetical protein B0H14DRAFT_3504471 [Mycena olivaceomarginata]
MTIWKQTGNNLTKEVGRPRSGRPAPCDIYEPHYELEPDIDYPAYEGMVDGDEYESEVVEQASWDKPRYAPHHALYGSEDIAYGCMPRELEDTSFDVLALDAAYAVWQGTWATGPALDEDEDAWARAMDSWHKQIEASHGADASEDLVYTSLPDNRLVVGDNLWTSPEREQLQEAFERGGISDEEYVHVLGELWDEQLEIKQLDERLHADGYAWDEKCDDYVHLVYGYASLEPDGEGSYQFQSAHHVLLIGSHVTTEAPLGNPFITDSPVPNPAYIPMSAAPPLHALTPIASTQLSATSVHGSLMSAC